MYLGYNLLSITSLLYAILYSIINTLKMYFTLSIISKLYNDTQNIKKRIVLSILVGGIIHPIVIHIINVTFYNNSNYLLIIITRIIFALLYCLISKLLLNHSISKACTIIGNTLLSLLILDTIEKIIQYILPSLFINDNLINTLTIFSLEVLILTIIYFLTTKLIQLIPSLIIKNISNNSNKYSLFLFILKLCFSYLFIIVTPSNNIISQFTLLVILILFTTLSIIRDKHNYIKKENYNKDTQIDQLLKSTSEFNSLKHDFYNLLQPYGGYLELGDINAARKYHQSLLHTTLNTAYSVTLNERYIENPALVSLLYNKQRKADLVNVLLEICINTNISNISMNEIDIYRVMTCLIDNAIEAASETHQKKASIIIEDSDCSKEIIFTIINSTSHPIQIEEMFKLGVSSKKNHEGIGLYSVKNIFSKYNNDSFNMCYHNNQMTIKFSIKKSIN